MIILCFYCGTKRLNKVGVAMTKNNILHLFSLVIISLFYLADPAFATSKQFDEKWGSRLAYGIPLFAAGYSTAIGDFEGDTQLAKVYGASMATTYGLKYAIPDNRPNGKAHSFPSGHATSAFAGAAYLQDRYGYQFGIPAYLLSAYVGYSRVRTSNHDWDDIAAGAAISIAFSHFVTHPYKNKDLTIGFNSASLKDLALNVSYRF
jgi:hypothetical protein